MPARCLVMGCPYKYKPPLEGRCHSFPTIPTLWELWYNKTGSDKEREKVKMYGICSNHFSAINYKDTEGNNNEPRLTRLHTYAIPDLNLPTINQNGLTFSFDDANYLVKRLLDNDVIRERNSKLETALAKKDKEMSKLQKDFVDLNHKNARLQVAVDKIKDLEERSKTKKESELQKHFETKVHETFATLFTKNQINYVIHQQSQKKWDDIDKAKAIGIYNASSRCYNYLREQLGYPFPSERSVLRWLSKVHIQPGIIKPVLAVMKKEFENFSPMQRMAQICFDEVSVDSRVELEEKHQIILGPFRNLMAVYVRGLFYSWKQIIYFDFDLRLTKEIINSILKALYEVGVSVVAITSDMCTVNVRVWKELGIDIKAKKYSFQHPASGENVWMFADFSHLLKLLRNHFLDNPLQLGEDFENVIISIKIIEELLSCMKHDLKISFKLTEGHIKMDKRKRMNVGTSHELFSELTGKTILALFPQYKQAGEFILMINQIIDLFNVHTKASNSNPFKTGYGMNLPQQEKLLAKFVKNIEQLRVLGGRVTIKPFQKGFLLTCGSLKGLQADMVKAPVNCSYIMTSHLLQDYVESAFGAFRGVGGFNDLPMPVDAIRRIKSMVVAWNLRCPKTGNVHSENNMQFLSSERFSLMVTECNEDIPEEASTNLFREFANIDPTSNIKIPELKHLSNSDKSKICGSEYIAGYIAKKFMIDFPRLKSNQNRVGWVKFLSNGHLISPSNWWLGCFLKFEQYFVAFHRSRYTNQLNLNRDRRVIDNLSSHLISTFPLIPKPAIIFYVRIRTKIRIEAINKKIFVLRRKRRAQSFVNSMILAGESHSDSEDDAPERIGDESFLEIDAVNSNSQNSAANEGGSTSSREKEEIGARESEDNTGDVVHDIGDDQTVFEGDSDFIAVEANPLELFADADLANEYEVLFDNEELEYSPSEFEIFDESEVESALRHDSDSE